MSPPSNSAGDFAFGTRLGLVFIVESGCLSFVAVSSLLIYVVINGMRNRRQKKRSQQQPSGKATWHFLRSPVDYYFLSLLISDLIQSISNILHIRWIADAGLTVGSYCTTQAVMKQVGDVGVALSALAIAGHTFVVLFFRWKAPATPLFPLSVVGLIWLFLILITSIAGTVNTNPPYYGPTTYWCWIDPHYRGEQIGLEYGIFWFVAIAGLMLYTPLFFCLRGNLVVTFNGPIGGRRDMHIEWRWNKDQALKREAVEKDTRKQMRVAKQMLAYPIAYIVLIGPQSVSRWLQFSNKHIPAAAISFTGLLFASSGLVNVTLYLISRPAVMRSLRGVKDNRLAVTGQTIATMPEATMASYLSSTSSPQHRQPTTPFINVRGPTPAATLNKGDGSGGGIPMLDANDDDLISDEDDVDYYHHSTSDDIMMTPYAAGHTKYETDQTMVQQRLPPGSPPYLRPDDRGDFAQSSRSHPSVEGASWRLVPGNSHRV